eukprot:24164-Prymnesium_polylepis.2
MDVKENAQAALPAHASGGARGGFALHSFFHTSRAVAAALRAVGAASALSPAELRVARASARIRAASACAPSTYELAMRFVVAVAIASCCTAISRPEPQTFNLTPVVELSGVRMGTRRHRWQ